MTRVLVGAVMAAVFLGASIAAGAPETQTVPATDALSQDWLPRWERKITGAMRNRYCDRETGEQLGWLVSPFLNGFHYGYLATADTKWIDRLIDWTDTVVERGVTEPDGYVGWPKEAGASTRSVKAT